MYFLYVKCISCFHSSFVDFFHVCNVLYNSLEFILSMLRLLFQTFIKFLLKLHGIHIAGAPCDGLFSLILQPPTKDLLIGRSTLPLFATPFHSFPYASVPYTGFRLHFQWSLAPIIPPCISPQYTLSQSGSWPPDYP